MLRIVFVKSGDAFGSDYVNILADMCRRNLPEGFPGQFVCFTDDPKGIGPDIAIRPLPGDLHGWWNKLWLFKDGHFEDGDRILYLDLDTVIVGALDQIVQYSGSFAILRDFYRPDGLQSSVMAWPANTRNDIWHQWNACRRPMNAGGDQAWIETWADHIGFVPDLWHDLLPRQFVSFKRDCGKYPPKGAKVVVFHGLPRPHECETDWVWDIWAINGGQGFDLEQVCNTETDKIFSNVRRAV
jgi:hypothetical protein